MIDITSVTIGLFVGSCFGFLIAAVVSFGKIRDLIAENERLSREPQHLTDRDAHGRFVKRNMGEAL
jgi:hypothetical protein